MAMEPEQEWAGPATVELVRDFLSKKTVDELKDIARDQSVDISGLKHKDEIIEALVEHPGIDKIIWPMSQETPLPPFDEEVSVEPEVMKEPSRKGSASKIEPIVSEALASKVDFSSVQSMLSEAGNKFQSRNYDTVISLIRDSVVGVEDVVKRYLKTAWAYAISASDKILEDSERTSDPARQAIKALEEAKKSFAEGSFIQSPRVLDFLHSTTTNLYQYEMERAREHVKAQIAALKDVQAMGGDVAKAAEILTRAAEALKANNRSLYLEYIAEADDLTAEARSRRIEEIRAALPSVESTIEEGKSIGADLTEASQLLGQTKAAIDRGDFIVGNDLVQKSERVALEAQKVHIDKVAELQRKQLEKVKNLVAKIRPIVDKAQARGLDIATASEHLRLAADCITQGDYVNGLLHAKEAAESVKALQSALTAEHPKPEPPKPWQEPAKQWQEPPKPFEPEKQASGGIFGRRKKQ